MRRLVPFAVLAFVAAGCGSSQSGPAETARCLREQGFTVRENKVTETFLATGIEHAQVATYKGDQALLLYAKNGILANRALGELKQLVAQLGDTGSTGDLPVRREKNVLVSWLDEVPAGGDDLIDGCL